MQDQPILLAVRVLRVEYLQNPNPTGDKI